MTKQLAIKLLDELVAEIDRLVEGGTFGSRSHAIRTGVEAVVGGQRRRDIDQGFREGATRFPETGDDIEEASTRSVVRPGPRSTAELL